MGSSIREILKRVDQTKTASNPDGNPFLPSNLSVDEAEAAINEHVQAERDAAYLEGQKRGKNNYHLGYLSADDKYAVEREAHKFVVSVLEELKHNFNDGKQSHSVAVINTELDAVISNYKTKAQEEE